MTATDITEDLDAIVAAADRYFRDQLPEEWVAAVDRDDLETLSVVRQSVDPDGLWSQIAAGGYVVPTWPIEYGGLGLSRKAGSAVAKALGAYRMPRFNNPVGVDLAGPAILKWGTEEQKQKYVRRIATYEDIWCQLFSEPGSGSDLAGLSTKAVRDGDMWTITGQKVWSSLGDISAYGLLLARTTPELPKHQGITAFLLPMRIDGVTIRPLRQLTGDAEFCEVFLDEAQIDDSMRLGPVNDGWRVAISVLMNERQTAGGSGASMPGTTQGRSVHALMQRHKPFTDPVQRQRMVQAYIESNLVAWTNKRAGDRRRAGQAPGAEGSIGKLFFSEHLQRLQNLAADLEGPHVQAFDPEDRWLKNTAWSMLRVRSKTIAGGTSEVQRNILGERILGLPKEPEVDRSIPWSEVRRS